MSYKILSALEIIEKFKKQLSSIQTGRVTGSVLDTLLVEAYGAKMHIKEIATVTVPEPAQLMVTPFDKGLIQAIAKAINDSNLGVNPQDDGAGVRLVFPPLTEEARKNRVKDVYKLMEDSRIEVRLKRQDVLKTKKKEKEDGFLSENELTAFETELQKEVDNLNKEIEDIAKVKEGEIMKV